MIDIYIGIIILYAFSAALFLTGIKLARSAPRWLTVILMVVTLSLLFYSGNSWHENLHLARALPLSNLIVIADVLPIEGALMIGLAWPLISGTARRKLVWVVPLLGICMYQANWPLFARGPMVGDRWRDDVCRQTTDSTCGPAAAATLLQRCGIPATEAEMAALCFTTSSGTSMLGLYRGLKIKTDGTNWQALPFVGTRDELKQLGALPAIISVGIDGASNADSLYERQAGWIPGVSHTVVLFDFLNDGKLDVGDPAVGREVWSSDDLDALWHGEGIYLVKRK